MPFEKVKGTADFYPEDKEAMNIIYEKLRDVARRYSFNEVESPAFENIDLLTAKSGEEIKTQIFCLEKRSKEEQVSKKNTSSRFSRRPIPDGPLHNPMQGKSIEFFFP